MNIFPFYLIYAPFLLVMAVGVAMYIWGLNASGKGKEIAKFFGMLIAFLSILVMLYNTYIGLKSFKEGCACASMGMQCMMGDHADMPMKGKSMMMNDHADMKKK